MLAGIRTQNLEQLLKRQATGSNGTYCKLLEHFIIVLVSIEKRFLQTWEVPSHIREVPMIFLIHLRVD
jgi:hypothetical protein